MGEALLLGVTGEEKAKIKITVAGAPSALPLSNITGRTLARSENF